MSNFFKKPAAKAKLSFNGFDLSRRRIFTSPCGMLLPIYKRFMTPGEKVKLNSRSFIRTEAIQTAAFTRLTAHVDWFFVPINQLMSLWNEFFNQTQDIESSAFYGDTAQNIMSGVELPTYNSYYILSQPFGNGDPNLSIFGRLNDPSAAVGGDNQYILYNDDMGVPYIWNFRRLWDMLGYGSLSRVPSGWNASDPSTAIGLTLPFFDYLAYHKIFYGFYNKSQWFKNDVSLYNVDSYFTRTSDLPNYPKILSTIHYRPFKVDYFTNVFPQPIFGTNFANAIGGGFLVDTDPYSSTQESLSESLRALINPEGNTSKSSDSGTPNAIFTKLGDDAADGSDLIPTYARSNNVRIANHNAFDEISTTDIRAMFALDKLLRITAMNGAHYEDQTLAHFGYKMPKGISKEPYYIGSQHTPININEVVATSTTTASGAGSVIGDIAGKGFSGPSKDGKDLSFECPCHGFIMGIFSVEPDPDYASFGVEMENRYVNNLDFFRPELDNIGMQPMFGQFNGITALPNSEDVFGWTYRYAELKTSFDVVNEGFHSTNLDAWVTYKQSGYKYGDTISPFNMFYVSPQYTNNIFLKNFPKYGEGHYLNTSFNNIGETFWPWSYNESPEHSSAVTAMDVYSADNFLVCMDIKCYLSSPMSVHSLPKML